MRIRAALPADAGAIARVQVASWGTTYRGIVADPYIDALSVAERERRWRTMLTDPLGRCFAYVAADDDGEIVGFGSGGPQRSTLSGYEGELQAIYLLQRAQRQGVGRALTRAIAQRLLDDGMSSMVVWVLADNPSRAFYEALGGMLVEEQSVVVGEQTLQGVAYGWRDLAALLTRSTGSSARAALPRSPRP